MRHVIIDPNVINLGNIAKIVNVSNFGDVVLKGDDARHLATVLRIRPGERLILLDGQSAFEAEVSATGKDTLDLLLVSPVPLPPDPPIAITVAQALGKGDRFDEALEHATEVGATGFIPLLTARTIVKVDKDASSKLVRWQRILKGAAEQSHRARAPFIEAPVSCKQLCGRLADFDTALLLDPTGKPLRDVLKVGSDEGLLPSSLLLIVGPEGGFAPEEIELLSAAGAVPTSLGPFVMRTETAAVAAISAILGNFTF
jgi:16S rRNA (uracil1498-N3)-methyltransferase